MCSSWIFLLPASLSHLQLKILYSCFLSLISTLPVYHKNRRNPAPARSSEAFDVHHGGGDKGSCLIDLKLCNTDSKSLLRGKQKELIFKTGLNLAKSEREFKMLILINEELYANTWVVAGLCGLKQRDSPYLRLDGYSTVFYAEVMVLRALQKQTNYKLLSGRNERARMGYSD